MRKKIAVYTGTRNLYDYMVTAVKSLIMHSSVEKIYLLIEDDVFPYWLPSIVETINVSNQTIFRKDGPNMGNVFTYMALMRVALTKYFPHEPYILTLDVDTIVDDYIDDIWELPIEDYYFAAAKEPLCSKGGQYYKLDEYFNCGVVLWNLQKLRADKMDDAIITDINTNYHPFSEQDAVNILCAGKIYELSSNYNASNWTTPTDDKRIIHYAAIDDNDWSAFPEVRRYKLIDWGDLNVN